MILLLQGLAVGALGALAIGTLSASVVMFMITAENVRAVMWHGVRSTRGFASASATWWSLAVLTTLLFATVVLVWGAAVVAGATW